MKHLIVLIDALGWLTVERLGFLPDLLPYRRPLTTVLGYSSTAIPSLLTGAWPREHGHWFLFKRAETVSLREAGWLDRLPGNLSRRWRIRNYLQGYWRRRLSIRGYFSLYEVPFRLLPRLEPVEIKDTWGLGAFPGHPTLVDALHGSGLSYHVSDWRIPDAEKTAAALRDIDKRKPDVSVVYLTEVDAAQHRWGTTHPQFENAVRAAEEAVRTLHRRMSQEGSVTLQVFSDHGMTDIHRTEDLTGALAGAGLREGRDYTCFLDSTVARFWDIRRESSLRRALEDLSWGTLLTPEALREWGVDFDRGEYGDLFYLADPGVLILPSHMGSEPLAAMHGYTPAHPTSDACFLTDEEVALERDHIVSVLPALRKRLGLTLE